MTATCPYCDYGYPDQPLDKDLLIRLSEPDLPIEDYVLLLQQQVELLGTKEYKGMKVHIGKKHKGQPLSSNYELTPEEKAIVNREIVA